MRSRSGEGIRANNELLFRKCDLNKIHTAQLTRFFQIFNAFHLLNSLTVLKNSTKHSSEQNQVSRWVSRISSVALTGILPSTPQLSQVVNSEIPQIGLFLPCRQRE